MFTWSLHYHVFRLIMFLCYDHATFPIHSTFLVLTTYLIVPILFYNICIDTPYQARNHLVFTSILDIRVS